MIRNLLVIILLLTVLTGCNPAPTEETPTSVPTVITPELEPTTPPDTTTETVEPPKQTTTPELPELPELPEEVILILEPGPGSRLSNPLRVFGMADPTFEQSLVVVLVAEDGTRLATVPAQIAADIGQRGPFQVQVPFVGEGPAFIQVYNASARDGGLIHLASVGVVLVPAGQEQLTAVDPHPERIIISSPSQGTTIQGGVVHVEGFGVASFEQTLVIEIQDQDGTVVGLQPVTLDASDLGQPGSFSGEVTYELTGAGPGRVAVRDISPAFGGDVHIASVEVNLEP